MSAPDRPTNVGHLGPAQIGHRVVVRRILRGLTGPSGGPAMTDVLGVMESWDLGRTAIRREDGELVEFNTADIVSGKPVPPRPSRFDRLSADEVERRAAGSFRPTETERVGDWLLRYGGGTNGRPNSILPVGDPGVPLDEALERATRFYAAHDRPPCAQVVVGSPVQAELEARGWVRLRPHEADTDVLLAGVAQLARAIGQVERGGIDVLHEDTVSRGWLVGNERALADYDAVAPMLQLPEAVFASINTDAEQIARGRVSLADDWAIFSDLTVHPDHRRAGLARVIMADLTDWSAEHGASVMVLQVVGDNAAAQKLYASLGFRRHHSYRYLVAPGPLTRPA